MKRPSLTAGRSKAPGQITEGQIRREIRRLIGTSLFEYALDKVAYDSMDMPVEDLSFYDQNGEATSELHQAVCDALIDQVQNEPSGTIIEGLANILTPDVLRFYRKQIARNTPRVDTQKEQE